MKNYLQADMKGKNIISIWQHRNHELGQESETGARSGLHSSKYTILKWQQRPPAIRSIFWPLFLIPAIFGGMLLRRRIATGRFCDLCWWTVARRSNDFGTLPG